MLIRQFSLVFFFILLQACSSGSDPATNVADADNESGSTDGGENASGENEAVGNEQSAMPKDCGNDHPAVGSEAEFSMIAHDVSGTLNVIDNCTLQITNFNYDGRGPDVYFYAAQNQDYTGPGYFQVGERINGTTFEDDTIVLELPEGKTLDDLNSLSVWCVLFGANFGDAFWGGG